MYLDVIRNTVNCMLGGGVVYLDVIGNTANSNAELRVVFRCD